MKSSWNESLFKGKGPLDALVERSRLIGKETNLCVWGGGNTSSKMDEKDHLGKVIPVLRVKGSGSDLKTCLPHHFSPLKLDEVLPALHRKTMSDEEMVDYLQRCLVNPKAPRPSIEALLHAFVPSQAIDHTHADAILSLTNTRNARAICAKVYGDELVFIPYVKPGFDLAKRVALAVAKDPEAKGAILEKHGLITWGDTSKESYQLTVEMVTRAENFIKKNAKGKKPFGGEAVRILKKGDREAFLDRHLPEIRKVLSLNKKVVLHLNSKPEVLEYVSSKLAPTISQQGPATPDHMLRTKRVPCFLKLGKDLLQTDSRVIQKQLHAYAAAHAVYYKKYAQKGMFMLDPYPVIILIPGVGMLTAGKDRESALIASEIYEHSISVMKAASFIDEYRSLSPKLAFEIEYWPLELYKMSLAGPDKPLARHVALITGAVGGIGRETARKLLSEGAQVVVSDLDPKKVEALASELRNEFKTRNCLGLCMDVTQESSVQKTFKDIMHYFGGIDVVVSNAGVATVAAVDCLSLADWEKNLKVNATGHFLVARESLKIMKRQGLGGSFVFVATKNVTAPGAEFGAYSSSKAACAQLAKIIAIEGGPFGIRSNMVNPDGVFKESGLWNEIKKERAKSYGLSEKELEKFYQNRNLLQRRIEPEHVAEAIYFLSSELSSRTTGTMLPVDGGLREAFPR